MKHILLLTLACFLACSGCEDTANSESPTKVVSATEQGARSVADAEEKARLREKIRSILFADRYDALDYNSDYFVRDPDFVDPILDKLFAEEYEFWMQNNRPDFNMFFGIARTRYKEALTTQEGLRRLEKQVLERFTHPVVTEKITSVPAPGKTSSEVRQAVQTVVAVAHGEVPNTLPRSEPKDSKWVAVDADYGLMPGELRCCYRNRYSHSQKEKEFFDEHRPATALVATQLSQLLQLYPDANVITLKMKILETPGPFIFVYRVRDSVANDDALLSITFPHDVSYGGASMHVEQVKITQGDLSPYLRGQSSFYPDTSIPFFLKESSD